MSSSEEDPYSSIFSSLKHPTRRLVLRSLAETPNKRFSELQSDVKVDSPSLSYHLEALSGLVEKNGETYSLTELGRSALNLMQRVEEPRPRPFAGKLDRTHTAIAWIMVLLLIGFGIPSLFFTTTFDNPVVRWLSSTPPYNIQPGAESSFVIAIKYDSNQIMALRNGEFIGAIQRPVSTPWTSTVNYASFTFTLQNGTNLKYWLTGPNGQPTPNLSEGQNQYTQHTVSNEASSPQEITAYTPMVDEGNYSLHLQNIGQAVEVGNVTLGPSRVVYTKPFFFIGVTFLVPALSFIGVSVIRPLKNRFSRGRILTRNKVVD